MHDREAAERTFLHLSMRRVSEREVVPSSAGPWAVFGWTMITLAAIFTVLMIVFLFVFMIPFFSEPGVGA